MDRAYLHSGKYRDAVFRRATLTDADLGDAELRGATFEGAEVTGLKQDFAEDIDLSGSSSRMSVGWLIFFGIAGLLGLWIVVGLTRARVRRRRAAREQAAERAVRFEDARRVQEENVTRLGEEIDGSTDRTGDVDWNAVLDAYDAAKEALASAHDMSDLTDVETIVARGRKALTRRR